MRITAIETAELGPQWPLPGLLLVQVHTDEGLVGLGETFYGPTACREIVHRDIATALIGTDPREIERHWRFLFDIQSHVAGRGAEVRALSAVDVALWDIAGQAAGMPIHQLLGGPCFERLPVYNSGFGTADPTKRDVDPSAHRAALKAWHGYNDPRASAFRADILGGGETHAPGAFATTLLEAGVDGIKFAPFDGFARRHRGLRIDRDDLHAGLEPVREIRDAAGDRMRIMIEGHGMWALGPAVEIARALEPYDVTWVEDLVRATDVDLVARLRAATRTPVCASEYLVGRTEYLRLLQADAADVVMMDPTWTGGITECRKIAILADSFGRPVTHHDCTGPVTLMAGVHLGFAAANTLVQETTRRLMPGVYAELVDGVPAVEDGAIAPPTAPGLGMALRPELREHPDVTWRRTGA